MTDNDPLHGVKLAEIVSKLHEKVGWKKMGETLGIKCFTNNPSQKSSLKFLRTTPWARTRVEIMYLKTFCSKHPATTGLIRGLLAQQDSPAKVKSLQKSAKRAKDIQKEEDTFAWPTVQKKK